MLTPLFYLKTHVAQGILLLIQETGAVCRRRTVQHEVSKQNTRTQNGTHILLVQPKDEQGGTGNDSVMKRGFERKIILFVTISRNSFTLSSFSLSSFIAGLGWPCRFGREDRLVFSLSV